MHQKYKHTTTLLLLFTVVLVWTLLAYKLFFISDEKQDKSPIKDFQNRFLKVRLPSNDSITLHKHYRDPFLGKKQKTTSHKKQKPSVPKSPKLIFPSINYIGFIQNDTDIRFVLQINKIPCFFEVGDTFAEITLLEGTKETIRVSFNRQQLQIPFKKP